MDKYNQFSVEYLICIKGYEDIAHKATITPYSSIDGKITISEELLKALPNKRTELINLAKKYSE